MHDRCRTQKMIVYMFAVVHLFERHWKQVFAVPRHTRHVMSHEEFSDSSTRVFNISTWHDMKYGSLLQKFYQSDKGNIKCFHVISLKPGVPRPNHRQSDLDLFMFYRPTLKLNSCKLLSTGRWNELLSLRYISNDQNLFHFKQKGHVAKKRLRGRLAPRLASSSNDASLSDTWRLVYLLCSGLNFMTPSKHLSIAYQGINLRRLLRFFSWATLLMLYDYVYINFR